MTPTEIALVLYVAVTVLLTVGLYATADDDDLDNRPLMFFTALMLLAWPVSLPLALWKARS